MPENSSDVKANKPVPISWADQMAMEDDENNYDDSLDLPPPSTVIDGDLKIVTEYRVNNDGTKIKVIRYYKIEKRKQVARRKTWKKFGESKGDPPGPNPADTNICEDTFMEFVMKKDENQSNKNEDFDNVSKSKQLGKGIVKCRYCEQDHWTTQCPYKDKLELLPSAKEKEAASGGPSSSGGQGSGNNDKGGDEGRKGGPGKYVPPSLREGGNRKGDVMTSSKGKDDPTTIRVTNLPEEIQDGDIRELFNPFGRISRIFLAKDKYTGHSKGFAFVSYEKKEDAARAIESVNGYGYANLILSVEWAKPSGN